jgi:hypothetical protein
MLAFLELSLKGEPEKLVGRLGILILVCWTIWLFVRWLLQSPIQPDPWDAQVAADIAGGETVPLCHRCLEPHEVLLDFCPHCGAPVGDYTNLLPFPYLFSIGHTLRIGTAGEFRHSPLTVAGFFLIGVAEYSIFAPIYWFMFIKGLFHPQPDMPDSSPVSPASDVDETPGSAD